MSSIHDMISAFIAMLMSAAFLHFGATGDSRPVKPATPAVHVSVAARSAISPVVDTESDDDGTPPPAPRAPARHLAVRSHCHGSAGAMPAMDAVRATSPLRRG